MKTITIVGKPQLNKIFDELSQISPSAKTLIHIDIGPLQDESDKLLERILFNILVLRGWQYGKVPTFLGAQ